MHAAADRALHERVVRRVVLDRVDAVPEAIVGLQLRRMAIGERRMGLGLGRSHEAPEIGGRARDPRHARAPHRRGEPRIA